MKKEPDFSPCFLCKKIEDALDVLNVGLFDLKEELCRISLVIPANLEDSIDKISRLYERLEDYPEWIPIASLKEETGLTADAIRKKLQNPALFEPEVDYRKIGRNWYVNKRVLARIRRQK